MRLAFLTGALASGFAVAALVTLVIWILTIVIGSSDPWSAAPWVVGIAGAIGAGATYLAEAFLHRRSLSEKRATGEPWAYREGP